MDTNGLIRNGYQDSSLTLRMTGVKGLPMTGIIPIPTVIFLSSFLTSDGQKV